MSTEHSERFLRKLNWGALLLTPIWLVRNGFLITGIASAVAAVWIGPLASLPFGVLFFLRGTRWSWGNGNRWRSFDDFANSQVAWNHVAYVCLGTLALLAAEAIYKWLQIVG